MFENIRFTTGTSRKNNHSMHNGSFYRLAQFIEYKAIWAGITVEYVNRVYPSQTCTVSGYVYHANGRLMSADVDFISTKMYLAL